MTERKAILTGRVLAAATLVAILAAPGARAADYDVGPIHVTEPWARATPKGASAGAAYLTVTNTGSAPLAITADTLTMNVGGLYSLTPATTCSFTTPLVVGGTCVINIRYATPTTRPALPDFGFLTVANNGTATLGGVTGLALLAQ